MPDDSTRPLDPATWPDFAELVEAHNGELLRFRVWTPNRIGGTRA
jgi:hypothetical protein